MLRLAFGAVARSFHSRRTFHSGRRNQARFGRAALLHVLRLAFGAVACSFHSRRTFHSGRRNQGIGAKVSISPLAGYVYAYSKLQAYKSLSLCYRLNSATNITETETFPVCRFVQGFRPRLPASASPSGFAAIPAIGRSQGLHHICLCSAFCVVQHY